MNSLLTSLAVRINESYDNATQKAQAALEHARQCGELLLEAKERCQHGEWLTWLRENTRISARQSQRFMRLASNWAAVQAKRDTVSHLTLRTAIELSRGHECKEGRFERDEFFVSLRAEMESLLEWVTVGEPFKAYIVQAVTLENLKAKGWPAVLSELMNTYTRKRARFLELHDLVTEIHRLASERILELNGKCHSQPKGDVDR